MKLAAAMIALCLTLSAYGAGVAGKWNATSQGPDGQEMQLTFNFKLDGDKISGTVNSPMGEAPIIEGKMTGDSISFTVEANDMKILHKGTVSGDEMKLKVDFGEQSMEMTAKRNKS